MRKQLSDLASSLRRQAHQHILEVSIRIMPIDTRRLDQAHDRRRPLLLGQQCGAMVCRQRCKVSEKSPVR